MGEASHTVLASARALAEACRVAFAEGRRDAVMSLTAEALAADHPRGVTTVALAERVRALHELGEIAEARRLWALVEERIAELARWDTALLQRVAVIGADLAQFGAGGSDGALDILRGAAERARNHGDAIAADAIAWDAVRRLGYAGRHRDLLTAIDVLGEPPAGLEYELVVPWAIAEALAGRPRDAADRVSRALSNLDREPTEAPLVRPGLMAAMALTSVWAGEPDRASLDEPQDPWLASAHAIFSAMIAIARLDWPDAERRVQRALQMREESDVTGLLSVAHVLAAQVAAARGDTAAARDHLRQRSGISERLGLTIRADLDHRVALSQIAIGDDLATVFTELESRAHGDELALPALWRAHARAVYGLPRVSPSLDVSGLDRDAPAIAARLAHLSALEGTSGAARQRALSTLTSAGVWLPSAAGGIALTGRQRQVAQLVSQGLTNREIGERLQLSVRTVDSHVAAVLQRLGASTRAEAAEVLRSISA